MTRLAPNRLAAALHERKKEKPLLDVRRQVQQVHDLGEPRPGDVPDVGQLDHSPLTDAENGKLSAGR